MKILLAVTFRSEVHVFSLVVHQAKSVQELCLPLDFYGKTDLVFPHYEVEILEPVFLKEDTGKLNYHYSDNDGKPYVCYPGSIPSEEKLRSVLTIWAVGQVCVLVFDRYLNEMITTSGGLDNFLGWAKQRGVELSSFVVD
jgi:hypothetical protein